MSTQRAPLNGNVPVDSFPVRLAIVRAMQGWNYDQASTATGINSQTWRMWEKGKRRCTDIADASRRISDATDWSFEWLMLGGPLTPENSYRAGEGAIVTHGVNGRYSQHSHGVSSRRAHRTCALSAA